MRNTHLVLVLAMILAILTSNSGCSGGPKSSMDPLTGPVTGSSESYRSGNIGTSHSLLGLYSCRVDPDKPGIETIPLRDAMFHLNALRFLEPAPPVRMNLSNFHYDGNEITVDVTLIHPFNGLDKYTGFDVCGIVISSGSISGFSDPDLKIAGEGDTRLVNADGLTRWWNPREFPYNTSVPMWGYIDGDKGKPDSVANYTATLNGYKYFADGLEADGNLAYLHLTDPNGRGAFRAGSSNTRHYEIELDGGLVFNYAIDASWLPPVDDPVIVPDSFPASANRAEPYFLSTGPYDYYLYYDPSTGSGGGDISMDVRCYDWFDADKNTVRVESPGVFDPVTTNVVVDGSDYYSTYHVDITNTTITSGAPVTIWVSAEASMDYDGFLPGRPTATYHPAIELPVSVIQGETITLVWGDETVIDHMDRVPYNDIDPALIINGNGDLLLSFFYWAQESSQSWVNYPLFSTSADLGHAFGTATNGQWQWHQVGSDKILCSNGKFTLGSNGQAFHSYEAPCGHTLHPMPTFDPYSEAASHSGTPVEHAGEMMYTSEGYPMMFGDADGNIKMQRGDFPNQGGTGSWPVYEGEPYMLTATSGNWLSLARSSAKTSNGLCHVMFWNNSSVDYIQMISSTDISGQSWDAPVVVWAGLADVWVSAYDPSLWIDKNDGFHTAWCATQFNDTHHLMYGYSVDGNNWQDAQFINIRAFADADRPRDTHVVVFDAFGETYVFIGYESGGNVWCIYKKLNESSFSEPIQVNVHPNATLPDTYPNAGTGVVFAYQADDGTGKNMTDVFYRLAEFEKH